MAKYRRGMGAGKGKGWKNIAPDDSKRHALSAKGIKTSQLSPRLKRAVKKNPALLTKNFPQLQKKGVFLRYQGDADKDGTVNIKDCKPLDATAQAESKVFPVKKGVEIEAHFEKTSSGFRHIAVLKVDGQEVDRAKATYQNRTWESYEFETAIRNLLQVTDELTEQEKEQFLEKQKKQEKEDVERRFGLIANVAKMGEVLTDTQEEKNKWKKRMLKAGVPELDFPKDWDKLSEDEKEKRLNKIIKEFQINQRDKDTDGDGVIDRADCDPNDPTKQDELDDFNAQLESDLENPDAIETLEKSKFKWDNMIRRRKGKIKDLSATFKSAKSKEEKEELMEESELIANEIFVLEEKQDNAEFRIKRLKERKKREKDTDKDGVPDVLDCDPNDPTKQDDIEVKDVETFLEDAEKTKTPLGKRIVGLGKKGLEYASELAKKHKEDREKFNQEVQNLNDAQLKELAVRWKDGFGVNPYLNELKRRIRTKSKVEEEIKKAKEPRKPIF